MKLAAAMILSLLISAPAMAASKSKCGKSSHFISCEDVSGAKRAGFCSKKAELEDETIEKRCSQPKRKYAKSKKASGSKAKKSKRVKQKSVPKSAQTPDDAEV